jgi:hypothetical protein
MAERSGEAAPHEISAWRPCRRRGYYGTNSRVCLSSGSATGYERGTRGVRGDVLLGIAFQAPLMAECFAGGAGDAEGGVGVSELVGASPVSEHKVDGDFGL